MQSSSDGWPGTRFSSPAFFTLSKVDKSPLLHFEVKTTWSTTNNQKFSFKWQLVAFFHHQHHLLLHTLSCWNMCNGLNQSIFCKDSSSFFIKFDQLVVDCWPRIMRSLLKKRKKEDEKEIDLIGKCRAHWPSIKGHCISSSSSFLSIFLSICSTSAICIETNANRRRRKAAQQVVWKVWKQSVNNFNFSTPQSEPFRFVFNN